MTTSTEQRVLRVRECLEAEGCDAFFSLSPPANAYLTGFHGSTSALIITASNTLFLCDFRYTEQARQQVAGFEVEEVSGTMESRVGERLKALGVEAAGFDPGVLSIAQMELLEAGFQGTFKALPDLVAGLRMIKSAEEIQKIRRASQLAESALAEVLPELKEGMLEREFAALLEYEFKRRGAEKPSFDSIVLFGARSSLPHGKPGDKPLERGDIVLIDCGCQAEGYCSDLTRTYIYGTIPPTWFKDIYSVTLTAQVAAVEAVRAGMAGRDVDAVARDIIREAGHGEHFGHGLGHGVGLEVHESPRLNMQAETVLEAGMVVTVEPGIYLPGRGGVRIEDLVVVTETGCEVLTRLPKELEQV